MKWYIVLVTAAEIVLAVLATLYVFHPRMVIVEKPFPTIVYTFTKPDTVYIKKYIQVQAPPVESHRENTCYSADRTGTAGYHGQREDVRAIYCCRHAHVFCAVAPDLHR